jgi:hypothetical protein
MKYPSRPADHIQPRHTAMRSQWKSTAINLFASGRTGPATPQFVPQDKLTLVMVGFVVMVSA